MKIHLLVEGPSEDVLLKQWLPRFQPQHHYVIYPHQGRGRLPSNLDARPDPMRRGLLDQLPSKLRAFGRSLNPDTDRVLVLLDADDDDCRQLKDKLLGLKSRIQPFPEVLFRIAVEETEAFYLGDKRAIRQIFAFSSTAYRQYVQDSVCGTWEVFQKVIKADNIDKVGWARQMGAVLGTDPSANRSPSFRHLCGALRVLAGELG